MSERFAATGLEKGMLDKVLNSLEMVDVEKLILWYLEQDYTFDDTKKSNQVFQLLQTAESQDWLAELVVELSEKHPRMMLGLTDLIARAKEARTAAVPVARPTEQASDLTERQILDETATPTVDATGPGVSPQSGVLLKSELLAMEEEHYSTQWWNQEELTGFVDRWQDLLPRAHAVVTDWRRSRWRASANADVRQLSVLDAIEVASQAFDQAEAAFIALRDFQHIRDVSTQVFISRRAIRCLVVAVEDVVNLGSGAAEDAPGGDISDGPPLSIPSAALTVAAIEPGSISRLSTALREAAPFVAAVAYYVSQTVRSSEDSLAAIARLVAAIGSCAGRTRDQVALATGADDAARWRSTARQLSEDAGTVLTELNIYWQTRR